MKIYDTLKNKLNQKKQKQMSDYIKEKYKTIVPEKNMRLLSDELLKIFEINSILGTRIIGEDWNVKSYQTFLK